MNLTISAMRFPLNIHIIAWNRSISGWKITPKYPTNIPKKLRNNINYITKNKVTKELLEFDSEAIIIPTYIIDKFHRLHFPEYNLKMQFNVSLWVAAPTVLGQLERDYVEQYDIVVEHDHVPYNPDV